MREQDAIQLVKQNISAFNQGDAQGLAATLSENAIYREIATQQTTRGRENVVKAALQWREAFPDVTETIQNIVASGNTVTAEITWEGTHRGTLVTPTGTIPPTGQRMQVQVSQVYTLENGQLKQTNTYFDMMTMLRQLQTKQQQAWQHGQAQPLQMRLTEGVLSQLQ